MDVNSDSSAKNRWTEQNQEHCLKTAWNGWLMEILNKVDALNYLIYYYFSLVIFHKIP